PHACAPHPKSAPRGQCCAAQRCVVTVRSNLNTRPIWPRPEPCTKIPSCNQGPTRIVHRHTIDAAGATCTWRLTQDGDQLLGRLAVNVPNLLSGGRIPSRYTVASGTSYGEPLPIGMKDQFGPTLVE